MKNQKKDFAQIQYEVKEKESILLRLYSAVAAFSSGCLLAIVTIDDQSVLSILASMFFIVSTLVFTVIALSKIHVIHKGVDLQLQHISVSQEYQDKIRVPGTICLVVGVMLMLFHVSAYCAATFVIFLIIITKHQCAFRKEFDSKIKVNDLIQSRKPNEAMNRTE